jgi:hypothetical protein
VKTPGVIYRLGRKPDPWIPPDWASAGLTEPSAIALHHSSAKTCAECHL